MCIRDSLAADLPNITADRVQLQQVLMNLMLNGIEAMKETGGVLTVKSQFCEDGQVKISVNDTGPGLPLGKADQIFDAFFTTKPQEMCIRDRHRLDLMQRGYFGLWRAALALRKTSSTSHRGPNTSKRLAPICRSTGSPGSRVEPS